MEKIRTFYHYTRFIDEIKRDKMILATSFARTYQLDWILENCPEELIDKTQIKRLRAYKNQNKKIVELYKKEHDDEENYESCYRDLRLKYKNKLLDEFFNDDGYILGFSEKFQQGWLKGKGEVNYVASIFAKIGNRYVKFKIDDKIAKRSYVLEQKYWTENYHAPLLKKKFGKDWEKMHNPKHKKHGEFWKFFVRLLFVNYYDSIVRLDDYKEDFDVPEFWIGSDIPISMCKFGKVSFKELEEKTGVTRKQIVKRKLTGADFSERKKKSSRSSLANPHL